MKFAICDTGAQSLAWLEAALQALIPQLDIDAQIARYNSADALLAAQPSDLIFLPQTELDTAAALRKSLCDCELVFVGAKDALSMRAFDYRPIAHVDVPTNRDSLRHALEQFLFYRQHPNRQYTVQTREHAAPIPHANIRFFHSIGHRVFIHTIGDEPPIAHTCKLDDVEQQLSLRAFLRCHQRYLVHLPFVARLDHQAMKLILRDGSEIPVSKRYFSHVVKTILAQNNA